MAKANDKRVRENVIFNNNGFFRYDELIYYHPLVVKYE